MLGSVFFSGHKEGKVKMVSQRELTQVRTIELQQQLCTRFHIISGIILSFMFTVQQRVQLHMGDCRLQQQKEDGVDFTIFL